MTRWIFLAILAACSAPKGLESFDSGSQDDATDPADPFGTGEGGASGETSGGEMGTTDETGGEEADGDASGGEEGSGATTGDETGEVGDPCESGTGIIDCEYTCWADVSSMIGDGVCDDGTRGPNFFCTHFEYDLGDCLEGTEEGGGSTGGSSTGTTGGGSATSGEAGGGSGSDTADATGGTTSGAGSTDGSDVDGGSSDGGESTMGGGTADGGSTTGGSGGGPATGWATCGDEDAPGSTFTLTGSTTDMPHSTTASCSFLDIGHPTYDYSYFWVPDGTGTYCITTADSTFDTVLSVWDDTCSDELACDDDPFPAVMVDGAFVRTSSIEFGATAGERYVILVDGNNRTTDYGAFTLAVYRGSCE